MPPNEDLVTLARTLLENGPIRTLPTTKRIRIQLHGTYITDTVHALYVWETHDYYPYYYVPFSSRAPGTHTVLSHHLHDSTRLLRITAGPRSTDRVLAFAPDLSAHHPAAAPLQDMVRVEFGAADAWFEEDSRIYVHPKDPFRRVDTVLSTRPIQVFVHGKRVATARSSQHLYETGLPTRYYLPPTAVDAGVLRRSETTTKCPYKGEAEYYDVVVAGEGGEEEVVRDVVWGYRTTTSESAAVAGLLCFYNEKVDIELDGERLERPMTKFS